VGQFSTPIFLKSGSLLHADSQTDPGTVISVRVSAAYALDHHQTPGMHNLFISIGNLILQLKLSHDPFIPPIKAFGDLIFVCTHINARGAMFYLQKSPAGLMPDDKVSHVTARF